MGERITSADERTMELANYGLDVLETLERSLDWNADTLDALAEAATARGLASRATGRFYQVDNAGFPMDVSELVRAARALLVEVDDAHQSPNEERICPVVRLEEMLAPFDEVQS